MFRDSTDLVCLLGRSVHHKSDVAVGDGIIVAVMLQPLEQAFVRWGNGTLTFETWEDLVEVTQLA